MSESIIMGVRPDGSESELCIITVWLTPERKIDVMIAKEDADAGWGTQPGVYDVWEPDDLPGRYRPWAKWRITSEGAVLPLRVPESDTPIQ